MKYSLYLDLDGVIVDFDKRFTEISGGIPPTKFKNTYGETAFWELIETRGVGYWRGMDYMPDGMRLLSYANQWDPTFLSSPSRSETAKIGKRMWRKDKHSDIPLILKGSKYKQEIAERDLANGITPILIDDRVDNIKRWNDVGGIGIHHTSASDSIKQLKELGL